MLSQYSNAFSGTATAHTQDTQLNVTFDETQQEYDDEPQQSPPRRSTTPSSNRESHAAF